MRHALLLIVILLTACNRLESGVVVAKEYESERDFIMFIPIMMSCGKNCFNTILVPYWVHDDEDYVFVVEGRDRDGEMRRERWYMTKAVYETTEIGSWVGLSETLASTSDEHERLRKAKT